MQFALQSEALAARRQLSTAGNQLSSVPIAERTGPVGKGRRSTSTVFAKAAAAKQEKDSVFTKDREYANWLGLPIQPGKYRRTVRKKIGSGIWVFEQTQGVLEVRRN